MTVTAEELLDKSRDQRRRGRVDEALISAKAAMRLEPDNADAHWQIALCELVRQNTNAALPHLQATTELAPEFGAAWGKLGRLYQDQGQEQRAKSAYERAIECDTKLVEPLVELAKIYEQEKDEQKELNIRQLLEPLLENPSPYHLNRLGILYHNRKDYYIAIGYYRQVATKSTGTAGWTNLGLVFNEEAVSQDVDAIDCWREVLAKEPENKSAPRRIANVLPKLNALSQRVRANPTVLDPDEWYTHYVSPFDLLELNPSEEHEARIIQKVKKRVLQEIDLADGRIEWVPHLTLDRSRAMRLIDHYADAKTNAWHRYLAERPALLRFLSVGDPAHFLVGDESEYPQIQSLRKWIENEPDFAVWLSQIFALQFDLTLTKAITKNNLAVVECMLDGRRLVRPEDEDKCFESAHREVDRQMQPLRDVAAAFERKKITMLEIINGPGARVIMLLKLLHVAFHSEQAEAIALFRRMAIKANNDYDDPTLAHELLTFATSLTGKSAELASRIEEDMAQLQRNKEAREKYNVKLNFGKIEFEITSQGIRQGDNFIPAELVQSLRWGTIVTALELGRKSYDFCFVAAPAKGPEILVHWKSSDNIEAQEKHFRKIIDGALHYLADHVTADIRARMNRQESVIVGPLALRSGGVEFEVSGWFSKKRVEVPWSRLHSKIHNGEIIVSDKANSKVSASMPLYRTDNAIILHLMIQ